MGDIHICSVLGGFRRLSGSGATPAFDFRLLTKKINLQIFEFSNFRIFICIHAKKAVSLHPQTV